MSRNYRDSQRNNHENPSVQVGFSVNLERGSTRSADISEGTSVCTAVSSVALVYGSRAVESLPASVYPGEEV